MSKIKSILLVVLSILCLGSAVISIFKITPKKGTLLVSGAISLTNVLQELATEFKKTHPTLDLAMNFGATGILQTQIEQGAPVDVFAEADISNMERLQKKGLLDDHGIKVLCQNQLALVVPAGSPIQSGSLSELLKSPALTKIGIGNPAFVPAGKYAEQWLKTAGVPDLTRREFVLALDVRKALVWAEAGEVDAAFVYVTDARSFRKVRIVAVSDPKGPIQIRYAIAVTRKGAASSLARAFMEFVIDPKVAAVFGRYGFLPGRQP